MTRSTPRADRSLLAFFALAFAISWGALGALQVIATASGVGTWQDLTRSAETTFDLASRPAGTSPPSVYPRSSW